MNKSDVIEQLEAIYQPVTAIVTDLTPAQLDVQPLSEAWSIKDILGHLLFWDDNFTNMLKSLLKIEPRTVLSGTLEEINAKAYADHHIQQPSDVLALFEQTRQGLIAAVNLFTDEQLNEQGQFAISGELPLGNYIVHEVKGHFGNHTDQLRQLAAEVAAR
jgi:hypothetical protein